MTPYTWVAPEGQFVISSHPHTFRVSSDNAMIDSGSGFIVECWDAVNHKPKTHRVHTGRCGDGCPTMPEPNATPEHICLYAAYNAASSLVYDAQNAAENAHLLNRGVIVDVVRGRKVPKGRYEVADHRQGQYGPYVNLRDATGRYYTYVSVENVKVVPDYSKSFDSRRFASLHSALPSFLAKVAEAGWTATAWGILADWIEEDNTIGMTPRELADALRRITSAPDAPKFSTYIADCHNEFRCPFARV
jgi:hypothetical protein